MSFGDFIMGGLLLGGSNTNIYNVDGKKYEKKYSDEFECYVLVPKDDEE